MARKDADFSVVRHSGSSSEKKKMSSGLKADEARDLADRMRRQNVTGSSTYYTVEKA